MRLWTIQKLEVMESLERDGVYRMNTELCENHEFFDAYNWLNKHLEQKDSKPKNVSYPIWAWYRYNKKEKKPDLRESGYEKRGTKCVCLELEVPDEQVLLSDFNNWHYVLNDSWFDDSNNEEEWEALHNEYDKLSRSEKESLKIKSWDKIFDIELVENDWNGHGEYIQAVFWELKKEYVKKVQFFTAR